MARRGSQGAQKWGDELAQLLSQRFGGFLATTTALRALPVQNRVDGMLCIVDPSAFWVFDSGSSAGASATVLVPSVGSGRWVAAVDPTTLAALLASTATGEGAATIGLEDADGLTTANDLEEVVQEILHTLYSIQHTIPLPIAGVLDAVTGANLLVFADASAALPGTQFVDSKSAAIRWNNHATPTAIAFNADMPQDLDDTALVTYHALVSKTGATVGDATKLTVGAFEHIVGALHDADADFGGDTTAVVGDATAKTVTELTLTLAAADIHPAPSSICCTVKPKSGTLGTDDFLLHKHWLEIKRKKMAS